MKHSKKIASLLLAAALACPMGLSALAADTADFKDIPEDWSKAAVESAIQNGLLAGENGLVKPDDNLTRAQMAAIVNRAFAATDKASIANFTDVADTAWYHDDMAKAVQMKTFAGADGKLNPENAITRQEAFSVLARAFSLTSDDTAVLDSYTDGASVASWAKTSMAAMISSGYVSGANGALNPTANISRKEFAQVMYTMLKGYIAEAGTYTEVADGNVMINAADVTLKDVTVNGDLVIGDGVGDGDVTLDGVKVTGRVILRGCGVNSFVVTGNSSIANVTVAKVNGNVRVAVEGGADVKTVEVTDGKDDVRVEGKVENLNVATDTPVVLNNAEVANVTVVAEGAEVSVEGKSTVENVTVSDTAKAADITVSKEATVAKVDSSADSVKVSGEGTVTSVEAKGDNTAVNTTGTQVSASEGTTGTTVSGSTVNAGSTTTSTGSSSSSTTTTTPPSSSSGSSSGGSSGGSSKTYYRATITVPASGDQNAYVATAALTTNSSIKSYASTLVDSLLAQAQAKQDEHDAGTIAQLTKLKTMLNDFDLNNADVQQWLSQITVMEETGNYSYTDLATLEKDLVTDFNAGMSFTDFRAKYGVVTMTIAGRTVTLSTTIA